MPAISQSPRAIFQLLKQSCLTSTAPGLHIGAVGNEFTATCVEPTRVSVPGAMVNEDGPYTSVTIEPGSVVDNRPETDDVVYFNYGEDAYSASETRWFYSSGGGASQTHYELYKWDQGRWQSVEGIA